MTLNMGRAKISAHELRLCLKTVLSHVNANDVWRGETLDSYCHDMRNIRILKMLENMGHVSITGSTGHISNIRLLTDWRLHLLEHSKAVKLWWLGFVTGIVSSVLASAIVAAILYLIGLS